MNARFEKYINSLTAKERDLAKESVAEYLKGEGEDVKKVTSSYDIYQYCRDMALEQEEKSVVLLLNNNNIIKERVELCKGTQTETLFDVRAIIRKALLAYATTIVLVHNHPSGMMRASCLDDKLTENVKRACDIMSIRLLDHVIICNNTYYSYSEQGKL